MIWNSSTWNDENYFNFNAIDAYKTFPLIVTQITNNLFFRADCSKADTPGNAPEHNGLTQFGRVRTAFQIILFLLLLCPTHATNQSWNVEKRILESILYFLLKICKDRWRVSHIFIHGDWTYLPNIFVSFWKWGDVFTFFNNSDYDTISMQAYLLYRKRKST